MTSPEKPSLPADESTMNGARKRATRWPEASTTTMSPSADSDSASPGLASTAKRKRSGAAGPASVRVSFSPALVAV